VDLAPGEVAGDLVHSAATGEMGSAHDTNSRRARHLGVATDQFPVIVRDLALANIGRLPARGDMCSPRACGISTALSPHSLAMRGLPRALGRRVLMPILHGFALRIDRGHTD
jgi:hypothetical protein